MLNISRMLEGSYWWPCSFRSSSRLPEYSGGAGSSSGAVRREYTADAPVTSSRRYEDPYDRERSSSDYYRRSSPPPPTASAVPAKSTSSAEARYSSSRH